MTQCLLVPSPSYPLVLHLQLRNTSSSREVTGPPTPSHTLDSSGCATLHRCLLFQMLVLRTMCVLLGSRPFSLGFQQHLSIYVLIR